MSAPSPRASSPRPPIPDPPPNPRPGFTERVVAVHVVAVHDWASNDRRYIMRFHATKNVHIVVKSSKHEGSQAETQPFRRRRR